MKRHFVLICLFAPFVLSACNVLSGSARKEPPAASAPAASAPAEAAVAPTLDLTWQRNAELIKPILNETGELVFQDALVIADDTYLSLSRIGSSRVISLVADHEADDGHGTEAIRSQRIEASHDAITDSWKVQLMAFLSERQQVAVGELVHRLILTVQDEQGARHTVVAKFRVKGSKAAAMVVGTPEFADLTTITRASVEAGTAFYKKVVLKNPYHVAISLWTATDPAALTLTQKIEIFFLQPRLFCAPFPKRETNLSQVKVQVVLEVQGENGRQLEVRQLDGKPNAWTLPPGETATLLWKIVSPSEVCPALVNHLQRVEWADIEKKCFPGPIEMCKYENVMRSTSHMIEYTRLASSLEGEASATWDSTWTLEYSPRHPKMLVAEKLTTGAPLAAERFMTCQGLY